MEELSELRRREQEKNEAVTAIEITLSTVEKEQREPDHWERAFLVQAIDMLFRGAYGLATVDAELALTPLTERSSKPNLPSDPLFERLLREALREAEAEPLRTWPAFGPVVFTR